ncbi:hypothetical protein HUJ05_001777 [Dendroctonus ponderosae]|nr:hypothetical protein HUJ05_001777 [Dendroctonus ponderosae]
MEGYGRDCMEEDTLREIYFAVQEGRKVPKGFNKEKLSTQDGCLLKGFCVVIPKNLRKQILQEIHMAHTGIVKMKPLARGHQRTQRRLVDQLLHFAGKIPTVQRPIDEEKDLQEEELLVAEVKNVEEIPQQLTPENPTTEVPEPRRSRTYRKAPQCLNL